MVDKFLEKMKEDVNNIEKRKMKHHKAITHTHREKAKHHKAITHTHREKAKHHKAITHTHREKAKHHKAKKEHHANHSAKKKHEHAEQEKEHHAVKQEIHKSKKHAKISGSTEKILVDNFVALQKVIAELARNFDSLSSKLAKLLELFEISAKTLAEKDFDAEKGLKLEKGLNQKIDTLIEHNKLFAKGLTLLHEKANGERIEIEPQAPLNTQMQKRMDIGDNYQKSISSKP